ncbi:MAG: translation initiation factor IF-2 subunit beta [Candidatus Diapherotrites archaeon]|nr:translation initiation factor IF-2 subunit beta [Candidatus Diapherotrites archaeon]
MEYEQMLERAYRLMPAQALKKERFELPRLETLVQGTKTIVKNFGPAMKAINREPKHAMKFLTREFAVPISFADGKLLMNGKVSQEMLDKSFKGYLEEYVLCHECGKPDTRILEQQAGIKILKCDACGASKPVKRL